MEEQQAIALLKRGNLDGMETLVRLYYFKAVRTSYLIVQDRQQAEDVVQESLLHAYHKIDQLASDRFGPWFFRIIINASLKACKSQKQSISLEAAIDGDDLSLEDVLEDQFPFPEAQVEGKELRQAVWEALERLPANHRAAIVLKYYLDMSESEMVGELDRPLTTVKWWLHAARSRLRDLLAPFQPSSQKPDPVSRGSFSEPTDAEVCDER